MPTAERRQPRKIRYSRAEWDVLIERARSCGKPPARYVRDVSLGVAPRAIRSPLSLSIVHELGQLGNSLCKIADLARALGDAGSAVAVEEALTRIIGLAQRLG